MTTGVPVSSSSSVDRLRWAIVDGCTIAQRDLAHWARQPARIVVSLLFPVMLVLMFGYLLGGGMAVPDGGNYREFLLPGMFALAMVFGVEMTFTAVSTDAARGVSDRFRSMPIARSAVVVGRAAADMLESAVGLTVMVACGLAVGWGWHRGIGRAVLAVALLLLLRFAVGWLGIYLGLASTGPDTLAAVQILVWPLAFLSNAFAEPDTMPVWLGAVVEWNPLSSTVAAARELFGNPDWGGDSWVAQHAVPMAVGWPLLLLAVFVPLSACRAHPSR